ncbi:variant erythrocyte surface antigen-1 alpha subunit [Babesia bovis T2Bo]|uniref:Variant erythrocyte surface antigen-1, putative n=1 Tax=Babesia bovis TaxID=5865 RepID=A7AXH7_BABBO|nr:variant erythrocyte surface antigen-1 alpha subunit [Babesia bovis T2Bo]KAG6440204.1 variant erythrocyte surface antigen-1 alpha subunit [Babesia bovis T2Bo]|eukprot:XP_001608631.1 variant erythrocyte surface antigen-1 [Babesia bovis T2Bo]
MAPASAFTPKASLTDAPTNLKEAIDWVLRVTGRDGKALSDDECICGLAAAVTDLLQSVELEYHGYQGDVMNGSPDAADKTKTKGATQQQVKGHLNGLFSLVQGLGGTAVVRTYIDQLAQVLSALVGWSKIVKCWDKGKCKGTNGDSKPHGQSGSGGTGGKCQYLEDVKHENKCETCGCMKWEVPKPGEHSKGHHLGRGCTRCSDSSDQCQCSSSGDCSSGKECKCALAGKCCKCCCTNCRGRCKNGWGGEKECICKNAEDSYRSAYPGETYYKRTSYVESIKIENTPSWNNLQHLPPGSTINSTTITQRRHHCARILLGSVCLIWSGLTYMYWTGKWAKGSPRWNNHILDGTGLDDGTLSQWLQALGFPKAMLNNSGPQNRLDKVIWDGLSDKLLLGFAKPSGATGWDSEGNTARNPFAMNYAGLVHTIHRDSFNNDGAIVFPNGSSSSSNDIDQHKRGALFKLYILSCAYFTGLQNKAPPKADNKAPRTIREILYWLSALPYSQAYPMILKHGKHRLTEVLKKPDGSDSSTDNDQKQLKFHQTGRTAPITVHEFNLFAHFQAVTQYCPLVLIGIQGGLHSTNSSTPAIHSLYANTECHFTYPTVSIQAYNQVVHYIRALFYQLYFLRKQCAVKVTCGGKWRECRYGSGVIGKDVVSWMCLGCSPMEHDRKKRVEKVNGELGKVLPQGKSEEEDDEAIAKTLKTLLENIGEVVVQLGNAQEALERRKGIDGVKRALDRAKDGLQRAKENDGENVGTRLYGILEEKVDEGVEDKLKDNLTKVKDALNALTTNGGNGKLKDVVDKLGNDPSSAKDNISAAIHNVLEVLRALMKGLEAAGKNEEAKKKLGNHQEALLNATSKLKEICSIARCPGCNDHSKKCGQKPVPTTCNTCHQQYMDGFPSPLQAFLEDRLPGFSCDEVVNDDKDNPDYPPAASHLEHCNGSGQCCPLPMGFRGQFLKGGISDCTGKRLYGILYFFSNGDMMQSCVYTLVRVTAALSATTPQVLGDVFGFFRGGVGNPEQQEGQQKGTNANKCDHSKKLSDKKTDDYFCGWCASGLRDEVKKIEWIPFDSTPGGQYLSTVGKALRDIKGDKGSSGKQTGTTSLSTLTKDSEYLSPLTGELYTAVSATFGSTYLSWVLYLSDSLYWGLQSLASEFLQIECRGCRECDPNKCKKGHHGASSDGQCGCQSIVSCTGVLPVLYRHGFSYGNPFNLEGYQQKDKDKGDYSIQKAQSTKHCHQFLDSINAVIKTESTTPLTNLLSQVGKLQYDIRLPWIFVLTVAWLVAVLYLAFGAIWPLDWTHMRSHWLRGGEHQWQCMWYKVMTGRKGMALVEYFGKT